MCTIGFKILQPLPPAFVRHLRVSTEDMHSVKEGMIHARLCLLSFSETLNNFHSDVHKYEDALTYIPKLQSMVEAVYPRSNGIASNEILCGYYIRYWFKKAMIYGYIATCYHALNFKNEVTVLSTLLFEIDLNFCKARSFMEKRCKVLLVSRGTFNWDDGAPAVRLETKLYRH